MANHKTYYLDPSYWRVSAGSLETEGVFYDPTGAFVFNPTTLNNAGFTKSSILTKAQLDTYHQQWQPPTLSIPNASDFALSNWTAKGWGNAITEILVNYNQFITANFATTAITLEVNPANYTQSTLVVYGTISGTLYFLPVCYFGETGSIARIVGSVNLSPQPESIFAGSIFFGTTTVQDQNNTALDGIPVIVETNTGTVFGDTTRTNANGVAKVLCTAPNTADTYTIQSETQTSTTVTSSTQSYVVNIGATLQTGTESFQNTTGLTQQISNSGDDSFYQLPTLPFSWYFFGTNYASSAYIGSNTYITFGFGSSIYYSLSATNPGRGILVGAADNSWQRVWHGTQTRSERNVFVIRYEGNGSTSGIVGSPGIVLQFTFFEGQKLNINVGVHNRIGGQTGISDGSSYNYSGTWNLNQNTTYALRSDPDGNNWTVYPGQYFSY
jgi:hypothetical protein